MNAATARVGKYTIHRLIAQGGMGKIYKARHPTLKRDIILKRLNVTGNRTIDRRFLREARLMMDFRHDHIVQVYDHFKEGPFYYIAMEYIDGISLADLIDKHRYLRNDVALLIFYEICKALKYAHDRGVIHRDIKPENILISRRGEVKLTDFGIARADDSRLEGLTRNMTLGTPAYMSPEQLENSSRVDCRSDIYSLGVVLYRMVTGRCPFPGNITPETITLITMGRYRPPQKINPKISGFIRRVIRRAM
ncbi:MAG: serine/threonine protein kinase, partial [Leptospiraceae bacterium]|nr:serine/threonine protein kinase [Leptospiraceae bacterium]